MLVPSTVRTVSVAHGARGSEAQGGPLISPTFSGEPLLRVDGLPTPKQQPKAHSHLFVLETKQSPYLLIRDNRPREEATHPGAASWKHLDGHGLSFACPAPLFSLPPGRIVTRTEREVLRRKQALEPGTCHLPWMYITHARHPRPSPLPLSSFLARSWLGEDASLNLVGSQRADGALPVSSDSSQTFS